MKYICAFLNTEGGKLYIGVDDNSYIYGAKFKQFEYDKLLLNIDKEGKFNMTPPLMPQKYEIKLIPVINDKNGQ
jgi:predicted HTH transcriptional regulator